MLDSHLHWKVKLSFISFLELLRFGGDLLSLSSLCLFLEGGIWGGRDVLEAWEREHSW